MGEEARLIEEAQRGSVDAFSQLLHHHQAHVRAYLAGFVRNQDVVDDLAQETFLNAFRNLGTYKAESSLRIWLLAISRNRALMHLRDEARRHSHRAESLRSAVAQWLAQSAGRDASDLSRHEHQFAEIAGGLRPPRFLRIGLTASPAVKDDREAELEFDLPRQPTPLVPEPQRPRDPDPPSRLDFSPRPPRSAAGTS